MTDLITLGMLDISEREWNLLCRYIDKKTELNKFFKLKVHPRYDEEMHNYYGRSDKYACLLLSSLLPHFKVQQFKMMRGAGDVAVASILTAFKKYDSDFNDSSTPPKLFVGSVMSVDGKTKFVYPKETPYAPIFQFDFLFSKPDDGEWYYVGSSSFVDAFADRGLTGAIEKLNAVWMVLDAKTGEILATNEKD